MVNRAGVLSTCSKLVLAIGVVLSACDPLPPEDDLGEGGEQGQPTETNEQAATVPGGFSDQIIVRGLTLPTAMQFSPDGRLFVTEKGGALRVIKNGSLLPQPFVRVPAQSSGERGLLGVAFPPDFSSNRRVFVYYTANQGGIHHRVSAIPVSSSNPDVGDLSREQILLRIPTNGRSVNHNGGAMHFGADGKLYVAVGDDTKRENAASLGNFFGKILRLEPDGRPAAGNPHGGSGAQAYIFAHGLRNPFTFAFRPGSNEFFINDVGDATWEEINRGQAGANYGWPRAEGSNGSGGTRPLHQYRNSRNGGVGCSIAGGAFMSDGYYFADYCAGWIKRLDGSNRESSFASGIASPVDLKARDGALYYLSHRGHVGRISRGGGGPTPTPEPEDPRLLPACGANGFPTVEWLQPAENTLFEGGQRINFAVRVTDDRGALPVGNIRWEAEQRHQMHGHDHQVGTGRLDGFFDVPEVGETDLAIWIEIAFIVKNRNDDRRCRSVREVRPRVVNLEIRTSPEGQLVTFDGSPEKKAPFTEAVLANRLRQVSVRRANGTRPTSVEWSNGQSGVSITLRTPRAPTTLTATVR